ncbi:auxin-responsive protein SAUR66-like [Humulus lupulus]|uniref:auxin-responsive protein SAUR66-like n=1 Tax=Humulus lupulus TaxID=3486 RepID=UPI002B4160E7|nr:auxin-responsive protein SAUR66-like [Humulus lupulus]
MDKVKKGSLINKTWERCKSLGRRGHNSPPAGRMTTKSKSCPRMNLVIPVMASPEAEEYEKRSGSPEIGGNNKKVKGCFSVYVGAEKQRFVVKAEYANHPLFKMLLEEAESEFGYDNQGPIMLPCNVDVFYRVLVEMDDDDTGAAADKIHRPGCGFVKRHATSYQLLSPSRMVAINQF